MTPIHRFLMQDSGAVTVDWTVLAASVVGLGLTSAAAVRSGVVSLGSDIDGSLSGASVASLRWSFARDLVNQNFADGNFDGWSVARPGTIGAWGPMQGPFGFDTQTNPLTFAVDLGEGASGGQIEFDLIIADTWDGLPNANNPWTYSGGDTLSLLIDGQPISVEAFVYHSAHPGYAPELLQTRRSSVEVNGATYNVNMTLTNAPAAVGGSGSQDQRWRVSITAENPPATFDLGFSGTLDQRNLGDESFGIANFSVRGA